MELYEAMRTTFSAREYTGEELPDAVLAKIFENARFAPSGGNRQAGRIIVVRNKQLQARIADLSLPVAQRYTAQTLAGETPFNPLHESQLSAAEIAATEPLPLLTEHLRSASVLLVVCLDLANIAALDKDLPRIGMACGASIYPLVWNVLLAARAEGYGGTMTTVSLAVEGEIKQLLSIPEGWAVATLVPMGKPVKQLTRLKRRPVEEFVVRDSWDGEAFQRSE
jgi:nitroreductase